MKHIFTTIISIFLALILAMAGIIIPSAYSLPGSPRYSFISMVESEPSEYGLINYKFVDQSGREVLDNTKIKNSLTIGSKNSTNNIFPSQFDLRDSGSVPAVRNQGVTSGCWAFAAIGALEIYDALHGYKPASNIDYSEAHLIWFTNHGLTTDTTDGTYGDGKTVSNPYATGGNWRLAANTLMRGSGIENDINYPFYPYSIDNMGNYGDDVRYTNNGRVLKSAVTYASLDEVKTALSSNKPVEVSFYFDNSKTVYTEGGGCAYFEGTQTTSNHSVIIVGWDDNYPATNFPETNRPAYNGAFLIRNSYSTAWGDEGYAWLSYCTTSLSDFIGYETASAAYRQNIYQYDGAGLYGFYNNSNMSMSNVFTADQSEIIDSISMYIGARDLSFTISVYKNIPSNYTTPDSGTLAYTSESITPQYSGYETIKLGKDVKIKKGEIFSVIVKFDGLSYVPVEAKNTTYQPTGMSYTVRKGESYIKSGAYAWSECTAAGSGNVCLKVFTRINPTPETPAGANVVTLSELIDKIANFLSISFGSIFKRKSINY